MPQVGEQLADAIPALAEAGIESARLDAEMLLAHVLGKNRGWIWAHREYELTADESARFQSLLERRRAREPLAYLLGEWEFYGHAFAVSPAVLVPRPETELLVEAVIAWARDHSTRKIADIGVGSGAIAVTIAVEIPDVEIVAIDISSPALAVARHNAERYAVADRISFLEGDLLAPACSGGNCPFDVIVANLPYIAVEEFPDLMPEVRDYEPSVALLADAGGLEIIQRLLLDSRECLRPGGLLALEVGKGQAARVEELLADGPWQNVRVITDYGGISRHLLAEYRI